MENKKIIAAQHETLKGNYNSPSIGIESLAIIAIMLYGHQTIRF